MPEQLVDQVIASRNVCRGVATLRQVYLATLDMTLHREPLALSATAVQQRVASVHTVLPILEQDRHLYSFSHIFAGDYGGVYYGYVWADVVSADAFAAFAEGNSSDANNVATVGRRFRDTVLALGGSVDPTELFAQFRGRPPSVDTFLRGLG